MQGLVCILALALSTAYPEFTPFNLVESACKVCTVKLDFSFMLSLHSQEQMCDHSPVYGLEVTKPFISRIFTKRGVFVDPKNSDVNKTWAKTWQLRVVSVLDKHKKVHHLVFPFVINTGGYSPLMSSAAAAILKRVGATESLGEQVAICRVSIDLPVTPRACVVENDRGSADLRFNIIGDDNAQAIFLMDFLVSEVTEGERTRQSAIARFLKAFEPHGATRENAEREFDLTYDAPVISSFPPTEAVNAILKKKLPSGSRASFPASANLPHPAQASNDEL